MLQLDDLKNHPLLKWMMYVVFVVVIISFVFFYGWHPSEERQSLSYARLKSDGVVPKWQELTAGELLRAEPQAIHDKAMVIPQAMLRQMPQSVIERLVTPADIAQEAANGKLLQRRAEVLGVQLTRDQIVALLNQQPNISDEAIRQAAQQQKFASVEDFLENLRRLQEQDVVRRLQQQTAHASLYEVWQEYVLSKEKIKLELAAYPISNFTASIPVTDAELQHYLDQHKAKFAVPDQRRYAFAKLSKSDLAEKVTVTSAALQTYYEKNQAKFHEKAAFKARELVVSRAKGSATSETIQALNAIRDRAATAADWKPLADELSKTHPKLSVYARESSWLETGDTQSRSELYFKRAAALTNDQVSTPVVDKDNLYLIKVIERRKEGTPPLAQIREKVESAYREDEAAKQFAAAAKTWAEQLPKFDSVAAFAKGLGVKDELTTRVERTDSYLPGFASLYKDAAYLAHLGLHELSSLVKTDDMIGVIEVMEEIPAHDPPLSEVRAKVETAYRNEKADALAKTQAQQSLALLKSGAAFDQALANAPKKAFGTEPFTRDQPVSGLEAPLMDFTTQTLAMRVGSVGLSPYGNDTPQGYAIWKVTELTPPTRADFAKDRQKFAADYMQVQQATLLKEWLADQRRKAQFEIVKK